MSRSGYEQVAHLYDLFDRKPNIEFFHHYAAQAGEVLDVGAGTGRIAIPLAERGIQVACVEPSPAMRREFERKLAARPDLAARVRLIAGTAHSFEAGCTFPAAILSGTFDHFLDDAERRASLANIARHLAPGGILVFDVFLGWMEDAPLRPAGEALLRNQTIRRFVGGRVLPGQRKETRLVFEIDHGGGRVDRIEERSLVGLTSRAQVHRLLAETGFSVRREWGAYQFAEYQEGDALLIVEARKEKDTS